MKCSSIWQEDHLRCNKGTSVNIVKIWLDNKEKCEFNKSSSNLTMTGLFQKKCPQTYLCFVTYRRRPGPELRKTLKIRFQCKGSSSLPVDDFSTDVQGVPMYALIVGGIVGVVIITCITVEVFRLRRRNVQRNGRKNVQGKLNPTNDTTQDQEANFMYSPDSVHMPASHAVNLVISTDASNTYSHLRSTEDDSDVMYDHTVRHNVHNTCEGDYGIAHRKITEDDYDVSGNYRQSFSNKEDPVYN